MRTFAALFCGFVGSIGCGSSDADPEPTGGAGGSIAGKGGSGASGSGQGGGGAGTGGVAAGSGGTAGTGGSGEPPVGSDVLCGERPGKKTDEATVLRFENAAGTTTVQIRRVLDGAGAGESQLFHLESFAVVRNGDTTCIDDASLSYTNTHHNWDDAAEAEANGVHYRLQFTFVTGLEFELVATSGDSTLFEEPLIVTGAPPFCWSCPGGVQVAVSELMPNNVGTFPDEQGEFEPWVELYNPSGEDVDLSGYTLSNDFGERARWRLPAVTIPRHQTLVIFADGEPDDGPLHTNFRLSPSGGELVLTRPGGVTDGGFVFDALPPGSSLEFDWATGDYVSTPDPTPNEPPAE